MESTVDPTVSIMRRAHRDLARGLTSATEWAMAVADSAPGTPAAEEAAEVLRELRSAYDSWRRIASRPLR